MLAAASKSPYCARIFRTRNARVKSASQWGNLLIWQQLTRIHGFDYINVIAVSRRHSRSAGRCEQARTRS